MKNFFFVFSCASKLGESLNKEKKPALFAVLVRRSRKKEIERETRRAIDAGMNVTAARSTLLILAVLVVIVLILMALTLGFTNRQFAEDRTEIPEAYRHCSIFVAISSYRDPELCLTLQDMMQQAHNRQRIWVGIIEQNDSNDPPTAHARNANIDQTHLRVQTLHYRQAKGPTYARSLCEKLWNGETYFMMTDSHMRFEQGWDSELIAQLWMCPRPLRTVLTCYPEGYERHENAKTKQISYKIVSRRKHIRERFKKFNEQGIVEFESVIEHTMTPPKRPQYVPFWAACFMFSHSESLKQVPYHPNTPYLFFGEEFYMGARFYTHGWDLRAPTQCLLYHLWQRGYRQTYWSHDVIAERDRSIQLVKDIMLGLKPDPKYGMGQVRTTQDYFLYVGVDFANKKTIRATYPWKPHKEFASLRDQYVIMNRTDTVP